ncbi:Bypass of stop codon protein-like protein [Colletotrichum karsti]|uniref:Bypass of stop codon protein-like protein n=1 Tax=Colletotrichum karsti TaxID=1095194 RepID=A0A9P6I5B4_9PEZI|nr:Bypass of stop codon protein-like protein [Colletotrichum karsti]KAF9877212.1 Bypass of stop codon protein-like protein [Colletotrichum karsti]
MPTPEFATTRSAHGEAIEMARIESIATKPASEADRRNHTTDTNPGNHAVTEATERTQSAWHSSINRSRLSAVCLSSFLNGFSDAGAGAIIPYVEEHYGIGYAVVSLIFVGQALGFIVAAFVLDSFRVKFGRATVLFVGNVSLICGSIPAAAAAPYPFIPISFFFVGFGAAINMALGNIFCGGLRNGTLILGILHGFYGIGGTISPLIATAIVGAANATWSTFYLVPLGISLCTLLSSVWVFRDYERELDPGARENEMTATSASVLSSILATLRMRLVLSGAIFIFAYQGAEVSISGWVISFLIEARDGDPAKVGNVTAGFWAGITVGRFVLSAPAQRWGEKSFVYGFTVIAFALQLLVWLVPNVIGNAVAVSVVGLMLGPVYPCAAAVFMRNMTRREALRGMVTISAFGSLGGAVAPFFTGLLAQLSGTFVLHPIVMFLMAVMLVCWYGIPQRPKREE